MKKILALIVGAMVFAVLFAVISVAMGFYGLFGINLKKTIDITGIMC